MQYPNDRSVLETFVCPEPVEYTYKYNLVKLGLRAMSLASKVSLRLDQQGVMSLQFMIAVSEGKNSFVDFRVSVRCKKKIYIYIFIFVAIY